MKKQISILFLVAIIALVASCRPKGFMFMPMVESVTAAGVNLPELKWDAAMLDTSIGESFYYEVKQINADGTLAEVIVKTATTGGTWKAATALPEGNYIFYLWKERPGEDDGAIESSDVVEYRIIVDTSKPEMPILFPAMVVSDSININLDGLTTAKELKWQWTLPADVERFDIALYQIPSLGVEGAEEILMPKSNMIKIKSDRSFSYSIKDEGVYRFKVFSLDAVGNRSDAATWTVETRLSGFEGPVITFQNAKEGQEQVTNLIHPIFTWTNVNSPDGSSCKEYAIQLIRVENSESVVDPAKWSYYNSDTDELRYEVTGEGLQDGIYKFFVKTFDPVLGGESLTTTYEIIVDTEALAAPVPRTANEVVDSYENALEFTWEAIPGAVHYHYRYYAYTAGETDVDSQTIGETTLLSYSNNQLLGAHSASGDLFRFDIRSVDSLGNTSEWASTSVAYRLLEGARVSIQLSAVNTSNEIEKVYYDEETSRWKTSLYQPSVEWTALEQGLKSYRYRVIRLDSNGNEIAPDFIEWSNVATVEKIALPKQLLIDDSGANKDLGLYRFDLQYKLDGTDEWVPKNGDADKDLFSLVIELDKKAPTPVLLSGSIAVGLIGGLGYPSWRWSVSDTDIAGFKYRVKEEGKDASWTTVYQSNLQVYNASEGLVGAEGDGKPWVFEIFAIDRFGNASLDNASEFTTNVCTTLPIRPEISAKVERTNNRLPSWSIVIPEGKTAETVWAKIGEEPSETTANKIIADFSSGAYDYTATVECGETKKTSEVWLYVKVKYADESSASEVGSDFVIVDLEGPEVPTILGDAITGERKPLWRIRPKDAEDTKRYRYAVNGTTSGNGIEILNDDDLVFGGELLRSMLPVGSHYVSVAVADEFGNWSEDVTFTFDILEAPVAPTNLTLVNPLSIDGMTPPCTNSPMPTFSFSHAKLTDDTVIAYRYRFNDGNWTELGLSGKSGLEYEFTSIISVPQGEVKVELAVGQKIGTTTTYGAPAILNIMTDTIAPPMPIVDYPKFTGDRTPIIYWLESDGAVLYELAFGDITNTISSEEELFYKHEGPSLEDGEHNFKLVAIDSFGNRSNERVYPIKVSSSYLDPSIPEQISILEVSKAIFGDNIRISWRANKKAIKGYSIYRFTDNDLITGNTSIAGKEAILSNEDWGVDGGRWYAYEDGTCVYYDNFDLETGENYYYGIVGVNDEDKPGNLSALNTTSAREVARGQLFGATAETKFYAVQTSVSVVFTWTPILNAKSYYLARKLSSASQESWEYLDTNEEWQPENEELSLNERKAILGTTLSNANEFDFSAKYDYRLFALSTAHDQLDTITTEGQVTQIDSYLTPYITCSTAVASEILDNSIFSVGKNDSTYEGKTPVNISLPLAYSNAVEHLIVEVERTYNYGGGHRGSTNVRKNDDGKWYVVNDGASKLDQSRYPLAPNPDDFPESKTIVAYSIEGVAAKTEFSDGNWLVKDTMYDTDANGNKLYACLPKTPSFIYTGDTVDNNRTVYQWFNLTQEQIDDMMADGEEWFKITDPDGTPSEHEWSYLMWDWAIRKQLGARNVGYKSAAFKTFDFTKMVTAKYQVVIKDKVTKKELVRTGIQEGYPALTPREFANLAEFLRSMTFYHEPAAIMNAVVGMDLGRIPDPAGNMYGTVSGHMTSKKTSSGISFPIKVGITTNSWMEDLKGCSIYINDGGQITLSINKTDKNQGFSMFHAKVAVKTPIYTGHMNMSLNLRCATPWSLVGDKGSITATLNGKNARNINENMGTSGYKGPWMVNEIGQQVYPNWFISEHSGQFNGRHTDINFTFNNEWGATNRYPGWRKKFLECWDVSADYWWDNSLFAN